MDDSRKIWEMPDAEALAMIVDDIETQQRGGRTLTSAAVALVKITQRYVPREHRDKIMIMIFEAAIEINLDQYCEVN